MQRFEKIKNPAEINLQGISIGQVKESGNTMLSVELVDANGRIVKFAKGEYSGLAVYVPAPPKTEKRFLVSGTVGALGKTQALLDPGAGRDLPHPEESGQVQRLDRLHR